MVGKSAGIAILAAALIALASAGQAQQASPCDKFAWPLDQEKAWFSGTLKTLRSGDAIAQLGDAPAALRRALAAELVTVLNADQVHIVDLDDELHPTEAISIFPDLPADTSSVTVEPFRASRPPAGR